MTKVTRRARRVCRILLAARQSKKERAAFADAGATNNSREEQSEVLGTNLLVNWIFRTMNLPADLPCVNLRLPTVSRLTSIQRCCFGKGRINPNQIVNMLGFEPYHSGLRH